MMRSLPTGGCVEAGEGWESTHFNPLDGRGQPVGRFILLPG